MGPSLTQYHKRSGHSCVVAKTIGINFVQVNEYYKGKYGDGQKTTGDKTGMDCTQWIATDH